MPKRPQGLPNVLIINLFKNLEVLSTAQGQLREILACGGEKMTAFVPGLSRERGAAAPPDGAHIDPDKPRRDGTIQSASCGDAKEPRTD